MSDSYQAMLQKAAERFYALRREYDRAREERDAATERFDKIGSQVRDAESQLCQSVGANIQKRLFKVDVGRFVLVRYMNATFTCAEVLELEDNG